MYNFSFTSPNIWFSLVCVCVFFSSSWNLCCCFAFQYACCCCSWVFLFAIHLSGHVNQFLIWLQVFFLSPLRLTKKAKKNHADDMKLTKFEGFNVAAKRNSDYIAKESENWKKNWWPECVVIKYQCAHVCMKHTSKLIELTINA